MEKLTDKDLQEGRYRITDQSGEICIIDKNNIKRINPSKFGGLLNDIISTDIGVITCEKGKNLFLVYMQEENLAEFSTESPVVMIEKIE